MAMPASRSSPQPSSAALVGALCHAKATESTLVFCGCPTRGARRNPQLCDQFMGPHEAYWQHLWPLLPSQSLGPCVCSLMSFQKVEDVTCLVTLKLCSQEVRAKRNVRSNCAQQVKRNKPHATFAAAF